MRLHIPGVSRLFSFSLQTQLPVSICLRRVKTYPTWGVDGSVWKRLFLTVRVEGITETTNSFRLTVVSSVHFIPAIADYATANVGLECSNGITFINGHIHNLAWKYLLFIPFFIFYPLLIAVSLSPGADLLTVVVPVILPVILLGLYVRQTLFYREILIGAIRRRLDAN